MVCAPHGGARGTHTGFWWEYLKERVHLEDLGVDVCYEHGYLRNMMGDVPFVNA
jgi:hypothetical protein